MDINENRIDYQNGGFAPDSISILLLQVSFQCLAGLSHTSKFLHPSSPLCSAQFGPISGQVFWEKVKINNDCFRV